MAEFVFDPSKSPGTFYDEAVAEFGMEDLGAHDSEPRNAFRRVVRSAVNGTEYPIKAIVKREPIGDLDGWEFFYPDGREPVEDWIDKVKPFDARMREYHRELSKLAAVFKKFSDYVTEW